MRVELAANAGFCFGVERAVNTVYEEIAKQEGPVCTYGPIIHNEEVIRDLKGKGVGILERVEETADKKRGTVIIRSHGITRQEYRALQDAGYQVVDATCPFVKRIHRLVQEYSEKGYTIIVIGNPDHPEVQGIVGWAVSDRIFVVKNREEAANVPLDGRENVCIVSQTTFNFNNFQELVEILEKKMYDKWNDSGTDSSEGISGGKRGDGWIVHNTICSATQERQKAADELSRKADAMFVIGGRNSSNTQKLYEICSKNCNNTYLIQTKEDLEHSEFPCFDYVGITAGASTPKNIIEEVQKYVRDEF